MVDACLCSHVEHHRVARNNGVKSLKGSRMSGSVPAWGPAFSPCRTEVAVLSG